MKAGLPAHEVTTAHLGAAYPFMVCPGFGGEGIYIGRDLLGGAFTFDPFILYTRGVLTNANMVVIGQIGRGKSSFVKSFLWRNAVFGRQAWVVDPKGEYSPLAHAWGVEPLILRPGGSVRLNPLDGTGMEDSERRQVELLSALGAACLRRDLLPTEHAAAQLALRAAAASSMNRPTIPGVVAALLAPSVEAARSIHTDVDTLTVMGRDLGLEMRRLVEGDLRGMFDGETSPGIDLLSPLVVLDLSAVYSSPALGVLMTCATAWLTAVLSSCPSRSDSESVAGPVAPQRLVVVDEAWAILSNLGVARWLQASWKLSRSFGVANMAVLHRLSDLRSAGAAGSEQVSLAQGLLSDSETRIVYAQSPGEVEACRELIGVTATEAGLLPRLRRGVALWKIGGRSFIVEHRLGRAEEQIVDTDARMRAVATSPAAHPVPDGRSE